MPDKYQSFVELARDAPPDRWRVVSREVARSSVLVIAPHGGAIEIGTSELAAAIAGAHHSLYCFEGLRECAFRELHVTSHRFDDPMALRLAGRSAIVIGIHGCKGRGAIFVGGRDRALARLLSDSLLAAGYPAQSENHSFPALHPENICNRSSRGVGVQLEFTLDLRTSELRGSIACCVREAVDLYCRQLAAQVGTPAGVRGARL